GLRAVFPAGRQADHLQLEQCRSAWSQLRSMVGQRRRHGSRAGYEIRRVRRLSDVHARWPQTRVRVEPRRREDRRHQYFHRRLESMRVVVPKEVAPRERRVALTPEGVAKFVALGCDVVVQKDAGSAAGFTDAAYQKSGATIGTDARATYAQANVILKVQAPQNDEIALIPDNSVLAGFLSPLTSKELLQQLAQKRISALAVELVPRITRAQVMDALSSQATIVGYKAALNAATVTGRFFPMLMTAAG